MSFKRFISLPFLYLCFVFVHAFDHLPNEECEDCDLVDPEDERHAMVSNIVDAIERRKTPIDFLDVSSIAKEFLKTDSDGRLLGDSPFYSENETTVTQKWTYMIDQFRNLAKSYKSFVMINLVDQLLRETKNMSVECDRSLIKLYMSANAGQMWTIKMFDAWGNMMPSGGVAGTVASLGDYDECSSIRVEDEGASFTGKYFLLQIRPSLPPKPHNYRITQKLIDLNGTKYEDTMWQQVASHAFGFYSINITRGICLPSVCSANDVQQLIGAITKPLMLEVYVNPIYDDNKLGGISSTQLLSIIIILLVIALVSLCTLFDYIFVDLRFTLRQTLAKYSFLRNTFKLLDNKSKSNELSFLHGIRTIIVICILVTDVFIAGGLLEVFVLLTTRLNDDIIPKLKTFLTQTFLNMGWILDTFLFISAFLFTTHRLSSDYKPVSFLRHIFQCWVKLSAPLILTLLSIPLLPLFTSGPLFKEFSHSLIENCENSWYSNIFFISNWWSFDKVCLLPSWFLSIAFQLNVIAYFVFVAFYKSPRTGVFISTLLMIYGMVYPAFINWYTDTPAFITFTRPILSDMKSHIYYLYALTPSYFVSFFFGVITGFAFLRRNKFNVYSILLIFGFVISPISLLVPYYYNSIEREPNYIISAVYTIFHRFFWSSGVASFVYYISTSGGKIPKTINALLSIKLFYPLSRLSNSLIATHFLVIWYYYLTSRFPMIMNIPSVVFRVSGIGVIAVVLAFFCAIFFEIPFVSLFNSLRITKNSRGSKSLSLKVHGNQVKSNISDLIENDLSGEATALQSTCIEISDESETNSNSNSFSHA